MASNLIGLESSAVISLLAFQHGLNNRTQPTNLEDTLRRMSVEVAKVINGTPDLQSKRDLCHAFWRFRSLLGLPPPNLKLTVAD